MNPDAKCLRCGRTNWKHTSRQLELCARAIKNKKLDK